jgi:prephenate dehydratase
MPGIPPARFAYLGPEGTFTEAALRLVPAAASAELQACASVSAALEAVRSSDVDAAMIPIENSVEGSVAATLDELATGDPLMVTREVLLPVSFALLARAGTSLDDVRRVATHPHAHAQCRRWLTETLPDAEVVPTLSTAAAAAALLQGSADFDAAIAARIAAERYRLRVLADGIADNKGAVTRFILVGRPAQPPLPTGRDKTSLVAFIADDHPGALLEVLTEFAVRGVNLSWIESRPTGERLGRYCFAIDCEGHVDDARVGEALMGLRRVCPDVRFLGSYPRAEPAGDEPRDPPAGNADDVYRDAAAWLGRIRDGRT